MNKQNKSSKKSSKKAVKNVAAKVSKSTAVKVQKQAVKEPKGRFELKGKELVYDTPIAYNRKSSLRGRLHQAIEAYVSDQGWKFGVAFNESNQLVLTNKMKQSNISRQRNGLSGFVAGFLKAAL
jgi:hypothetical protein